MKKVRLNESRSASSRNALKHGFTARRWVPDDGRRVSTLTDILKDGKSGGHVHETAKRAAAARSYLEQVIAARDKLLDAIHNISEITEAEEAASDNSSKLEAYYTQLSRLERYERQATVRWELTVAELEAAHLDLMIEE
jgi:hypothetical protein